MAHELCTFNPAACVATLARLAMLRVLQTAVTVSFCDRFTFGALMTFLVTLADAPIFNIDAPFSGARVRARRVMAA